MQKINLNSEKSNSIYVGDVNISDGVYGKKGQAVWFVIITHNKKLRIVNPADELQHGIFDNISELIGYNSEIDFFTLSGQPITTEKELGVEDLEGDMFIGFVFDTDGKGTVVYIKNNYRLITMTETVETTNAQLDGGIGYKTLSDAIKSNLRINSVYRFENRKALYKWLSE